MPRRDASSSRSGLRPSGATGCPPTPRVERRGLPPRPSGATGCSHGWSDAALSVAEPVEPDARVQSSSSFSRPGGAEESSLRRRIPIIEHPLRPSGAAPPRADLSTGCAGEAPAPPVATSRGPDGAGSPAAHILRPAHPTGACGGPPRTPGAAGCGCAALPRASGVWPRASVHPRRHATDDPSRPPGQSAGLTDHPSRRPGGLAGRPDHPAGLTGEPSRRPARLSRRPSPPADRPTHPDDRPTGPDGRPRGPRGGGAKARQPSGDIRDAQ